MLCGFVNAREYYIFFTSSMALKNDASTFTNLQVQKASMNKLQVQLWTSKQRPHTFYVASSAFQFK